MDIVADGKTITMALRHFSKRFANGKGGLSYDELARVTQLGSDALARSLALFASQQLVTSAVYRTNSDENTKSRRLFYLTQKAIERDS